MTSTPIQCDFCNELAGGIENSFARIYRPDLKSRVLLSTENFVVLPSLGQIVEDYLLLLPIKHFKALGDLPDPLLEELAETCNYVGKTLRDNHSSYILFEHGTRSEGVGGCGIYHAHLHVVPLKGIKDPVEALTSKFRYTELTHLSEIRNRSAGLPAYLFYQDTDTRLYLFDTGPLPSQYMRLLLANGVGSVAWDWRAAGREDRVFAAIRRFSAQFDSTHRFGSASNP
jgi:diadenosine tetraphosphate (Ap4A) HIT family hydrolase